ncbi:MAG TPA: hypothetical protein VFN28_07955 [Amaricoccus sp.]|nr:hypothetical protein [Amaricoccus sp.]
MVKNFAADVGRIEATGALAGASSRSARQFLEEVEGARLTDRVAALNLRDVARVRAAAELLTGVVRNAQADFDRE